MGLVSFWDAGSVSSGVKKKEEKRLLSSLIGQFCLVGRIVLLGYCSAKYSDLLLVTGDLYVYKLKTAVMYYVLQVFQN